MTISNSMDLRWAIDAGGTHTRIAARLGSEQWDAEFGSMNPASVGDEQAKKCLSDVFRALAARFPNSGKWLGWFGSAAVSHGTLSREVDRLSESLSELRSSGKAYVSGDVAPLLFGSPIHCHGVVVVAGTGSCAIAIDGEDVAVVGGCEYLASDEGGGFDLGLQGLRAAARACDGRGETTSLVEYCIERYKLHPHDAGRELASTPFPKEVVALFGKDVVSAAESGDRTAIRLVTNATRELVLAASTALRSLALTDEPNVLLVGGLFSSDYFRDQTQLIVEQTNPLASVNVCTSTVQATLEMLNGNLPTQLPTKSLPIMEVHQFA